MQELLEDNFKESLKLEPKAAVKFSAPWCPPCSILEPIFEKVSEDIKEVAFFKVDIDFCPEVAISQNIESIPVIILYRNGKEINRVLGTQPETALKAWLKKQFNLVEKQS